MQRATDKSSASRHFRLEQVADGVYAAVAIKGGAAFSNAGIVDLGDCTLIFDTFETPRAAKDLKAAAEHLTGRPATYVVNSHFHLDHWLGNQVFAAHATIIATHRTHEQMPEMADFMMGYKKDPSELKEMLRKDQERLETETDARRRETLESAISRWQVALESLPILDLEFPNQTFDGKLVFHGTRRRAELITHGSGHTSDDCFLVLPVEKVAFLGDLAFFQRQPFMAHCDPAAWVAQLEKLEQSDVETFVPGHGLVGTKADITLERRYITALEALVSWAIQEDESVEAILQRRLPAPFDAWSDDGTPLEGNVRLLHQRLSGPGAG